MSEVINKAKSWEIASIVKDDKGARIVFGEEVEISVGGRKLDKGEYKRLSLFLNDAVDNLNFKLEKGYIDQDRYDQSLANIEKFNIASVIRGQLV